MTTLNQAIEQFSRLPKEIQFACSTAEVFAALESLKATYGVDLSSLLILHVVGGIGENDIGSYLRDEEGLDARQAAGAAAAIQKQLFAPLIEYIEFINAHPDKVMALVREKNYAEEIFKSRMLAELNHHPMLIAAVNMRLFYILARDEEFKHRLTQALLGNEEVVTKQNLTLDGQAVPGTIGNWLKAYMAAYGSQAQDSVSQSDFLVNSPAGRALSEAERSAVAGVLKTYRNIAFFPDSMPSDDGTNWEIIPLPDVNTETKTSASPTPAEAMPVSASADEVSASNPPSPVTPRPRVVDRPSPSDDREAGEKPAPETDYASNSADELNELTAALTQYPAGSLERKALEEEIARLRGR